MSKRLAALVDALRNLEFSGRASGGCAISRMTLASQAGAWRGSLSNSCLSASESLRRRVSIMAWSNYRCPIQREAWITVPVTRLAVAI